MKSLKFSDEYVIKHGWNVDLGEKGDIEINNEVEYNEETGVWIIPCKYNLKGWVFSNCELEVIPEAEPENIDYADFILETKWDEWTISPTEKTELLEIGEPNALKGTIFEKFLL